MAEKESKPEEGKEAKLTATSATTGSTLNMFLLYSTLLGFGAIIGYMVFSSVYNHRCADLLDEAEFRFNQTQKEMQHRLIGAMENKEDETKEAELLALRGQVESHSSLLSTHESLVKKHQQITEELTQVKTSRDQALQQVSQVELDHQTAQTKLTKVEEDLKKSQAQNVELESTVQKREQEIKEAGASGDCQAAQSSTMQHVQHLHDFISKEKFGDGPYYAEVATLVEGEPAELKFMVEVPSREVAPHSVFAFLNFVEYHVYDGAEFLPTRSIVSISSDDDKLQDLGFGESALALIEDATAAPCVPYSVGFVGADGGLKVLMTQDTSKYGNLGCFGRISQGRQSLSRIQKAVREGRSVQVSQVRRVTESSFATGEL